MTRNRLLMLTTVLLLPLTALNAHSGQTSPASDPSNNGGWILNKDMSDEFEGRKLDTSKWLVQGTAGEYRSSFIGRAPSQFSTKNVRVEDGKLMLQTRWQPDFAFSDKPDADGRKYENITTAAVISKRQFLYGYMEIKCKAADASVTSSFWATGHRSELDVFEFIGARPGKEETPGARVHVHHDRLVPTAVVARLERHARTRLARGRRLPCLRLRVE